MMKNLIQTGGRVLHIGILSLVPAKAQEAEWQSIHEEDGITFS